MAHQAQGGSRPKWSAEALISLGVFLVALLPRAVGLGFFVTADEAKWVYRSAQFLGALLRGDLAGTVVNLTPAVTTAWLGSLGLAAYYALHQAELGMPFVDWLASLPEFRAELDVLVAVRWPVVLLTSAGVAVFYYLARRLTTKWVALIFALLLALDPHFIALSRVLGHDAPAGLFVGLSLLTFWLALLGTTQGRGAADHFAWGWLIVSGVLAGLAWLSKSPAFFLVPFIGLMTIVEAWRRGTPVRVWLLRLVVWGGVGWAVFVVVWPAGWQDPIGVPYSVVHNAFLSATDEVEAAAEGYWLVPDLGPFYYLVNGAFKLSILATLGLIAWAWGAAIRQRKTSSLDWWLPVFAVLFIVFMSVGGKRSNRYILPDWPALYLLAAMGLARLLSLNIHSRTRAIYNVTIGVLLLLLVFPVLLTYPYYFPYFNPLLGGPLTAPRLVKIGWGEGLDQVGQWLDGQPDAAALRVGSDYASALAPFFSGKIRNVTDNGLDFVVVYLKQAQGGYPSPSILRYFQAEEPLHTVRLSGVDYAQIYPGPGMQPALANEVAFDIGILPKPLAFRTGQPFLPIGQDVLVDVLWLAGDDLPTTQSRLTIQPVADLTLRPEERSNDVFVEALAGLERRPDGLVVSRHTMDIPSDLSRGSYGLLVDGRPLGVAEARRFMSPSIDGRLDVDFGGQLRLLGFVFDAPSHTLSLVWQASPGVWADYTVFVHTIDAAGNRIAGIDGQPPVPTSQWARGEVVVDWRKVPIPKDLPPGDYRFVVGLYLTDTGQQLPVLDSPGAAVDNGLLLPFIYTREPVLGDD